MKIEKFHKAPCHCGAVKLELHLPNGLEKPRRCDCSIALAKLIHVLPTPHYLAIKTHLAIFESHETSASWAAVVNVLLVKDSISTAFFSDFAHEFETKKFKSVVLPGKKFYLDRDFPWDALHRSYEKVPANCFSPADVSGSDLYRWLEYDVYLPRGEAEKMISPSNKCRLKN